MRTLPVLLVAAVAVLAPVPAASAGGSPAAEEAPANCAPPDVVAEYHPDHMSLHVTLPAAGCPARENRAFSMSAWVDRTEGQHTEGYGLVVACGPYPASDSARRPQDRIYVCELDMAVDHPSPESASYDISVHFPSADGEETFESHSFCTTGDDGAYCYEPETVDAAFPPPPSRGRQIDPARSTDGAPGSFLRVRWMALVSVPHIAARVRRSQGPLRAADPLRFSLGLAAVP